MFQLCGGVRRDYHQVGPFLQIQRTYTGLYVAVAHTPAQLLLILYYCCRPVLCALFLGSWATHVNIAANGTKNVNNTRIPHQVNVTK